MNLKIMADFCSSGIWRLDTGGMVDYDKLNLPTELVKEFEEWIEYYDSECTSKITYLVLVKKETSLHNRGRKLAKKIKLLFPNSRIEYWGETVRDGKISLIKEVIEGP